MQLLARTVILCKSFAPGWNGLKRIFQVEEVRRNPTSSRRRDTLGEACVVPGIVKRTSGALLLDGTGVRHPATNVHQPTAGFISIFLSNLLYHSAPSATGQKLNPTH